jgi:hypothetical protein
MTIATMFAWCFHLSRDCKLSLIDRIASTAIETAAGRKQPLVKSSLESGKLIGLWCREGGGLPVRIDSKQVIEMLVRGRVIVTCTT